MNCKIAYFLISSLFMCTACGWDSDIVVPEDFESTYKKCMSADQASTLQLIILLLG